MEFSLQVNCYQVQRNLYLILYQNICCLVGGVLLCNVALSVNICTHTHTHTLSTHAHCTHNTHIRLQENTYTYHSQLIATCSLTAKHDIILNTTHWCRYHMTTVKCHMTTVLINGDVYFRNLIKCTGGHGNRWFGH